MLPVLGNGRRIIHNSFADSLGFPTPIEVPGADGISVCIAEVDPAMAQLILGEHHIDNNRRKKDSKIRMYANDMSLSAWRLTHQGIAFNTDNMLCDGQNRLHACVESGLTLKTLVFFNVPKRSMPVVDTGAPRRATDAAKICGVKISNRDAATARIVGFGPTATALSVQAVLVACEVLRDSLDYVAEQFPQSITRVTTAPVLGAICRAYYHAGKDIDRLSEFCKCIRRSVISNEREDSAAVMLLKHLQRNSTAGQANTILAFRKTENAIEKFMARQQVDRLYALDRDIYTLPARIANQLS